MFVSLDPSTLRGWYGVLIAALLLITGCSESSNPVGSQPAADDFDDRSEAISLDIPDGMLEASKAERPAFSGSMNATGSADVITYTFDDLDVNCQFNTEFPATYRDLTFSDSRLLARCAFDDGAALVPTDLSRFESGTVARNLITLPIPAEEVSIEAFVLRDSGPRSFVAYDAAGSEIDRASFSTSSDRVLLTVTGAIHQVAIIDYQAQTYWDNLTVGYGSSSEPPVADAGPDQEVIVTERASLDGSKSSTSGDNVHAYLWSWKATPDGSRAAFADPASAVTTFTADLPGLYTAQLMVNDGTADSAPDGVDILVVSISEAITALADEVSSLREDGALSEAQTNSLRKMLERARQRFSRQPHVAVNVLKAFKGHVSGFVDDGVLSRERGDAIIGYADRIAVAIEKQQRSA